MAATEFDLNVDIEKAKDKLNGLLNEAIKKVNSDQNAENIVFDPDKYYRWLGFDPAVLYDSICKDKNIGPFWFSFIVSDDDGNIVMEDNGMLEDSEDDEKTTGVGCFPNTNTSTDDEYIGISGQSFPEGHVEFTFSSDEEPDEFAVEGKLSEVLTRLSELEKDIETLKKIDEEHEWKERFSGYKRPKF